MIPNPHPEGSPEWVIWDEAEKAGRRNGAELNLPVMEQIAAGERK